MGNIIVGRNSVLEALKGNREIDKLVAIKNGEGSIKKIIGKAKDKNIYIQYVDKSALDRLSDNGAHQGIAAYISEFEYSDIEDLFLCAKEKEEDPLVLILDGVEDPHNLGAIIRSAEGAGVHGIIIPKRRAAGVTDIVCKASAGAVEHMKIARVSNISMTVDLLKEQGFWIGACDAEGTTYYSADLKGPLALVIGGEDCGVSRLVKEKSDFTISIPMKGKVNSLNASNAAAIVLYEVVRQRDGC